VYAPGETIVRRYDVVARIGAGGMGVVLRARDRVRGGEEVALKLFKRDAYPGEEGLLRFRQEFRTMSRLRHPNTIAVRDFGVDEKNDPYFTMELVEGLDLSELKGLALPQIYRTLLETLSALAFIHSRGFVHRDVKPHNVRLVGAPAGAKQDATLLGDRFRVKLMDFGLIQLPGAESRRLVVGTLPYLPPEAATGAYLDGRADLFSVGVMAYEVLSGRRPWRELTLEDLVARRLPPPLEPLRKLRPEVPRPLEELVNEMLAFDPADRPPGADAVIERLSALAGLRPEQPAAERQSYLVSARLVGREHEMRQVRRALAAVCDEGERDGGALYVAAPAGAGKSRLLEELFLEAKTSGALVFEGRCRAEGRRPYGVLREALAALPRAAAGLAPEALYEHAPQACKILPELLKYKGPAPRHPDPAREHARVAAAVSALLVQVSLRQPVVLAIDDLQDADDASARVIASLAEATEGTRMLLVAAYRSDEIHPDSSALAPLAAGQAKLLSLPGFDKARLSDFLRALFGKVELPPRFVDRLLEATGGNPFFVTEVLRFLIDSGAVRMQAGHWFLPQDAAAIRLPASLADALRQQVRRLQGPARAIAEALSVVDRELALHAVRALAGVLDEDVLFAALDELERHQILWRTARGYRFQHAPVREALYAEMPAERRAECHRVAASLLQAEADARALGGTDSAGATVLDVAAELGRHYARGGDPRRGAPQLHASGEVLFQAHAYLDAVQPLREADEAYAAAGLGDGAPERVAVWERLGRIGLYTDQEMGVRYLTRARDHFRGRAGLGKLGALTRMLGRKAGLAVTLGGRLLGAKLRGEGLGKDGLRDVVGKHFVTSGLLAACQAMTGDLEGALAVAAELRNIAVDETKVPFAVTQVARMVPLVHQGRYAEIERAVEGALRVLDLDRETPVDPHDRATAICALDLHMALQYALRSRREFLDWYERYRLHADEHEIPFHQMYCRFTRLVWHVGRGEDGAALAARDEFLGHYRKLGRSPHSELRLAHQTALCHVAAGRWAEAGEVVRRVQETEPPSFFSVGWGAYLEGELARARGRAADAQEAYRDALAYADRAEVRSTAMRVRALVGLADALCDAQPGALRLRRAEGVAPGVLRSAAEAAEAALALASAAETRNELDALRARRALGRARAAMGDLAQARAALEEALGAARALGNPIEQAHGQVALAELERLRDDSAAVQALLRAAAEAYRALGNDHRARDAARAADTTGEARDDTSPRIVLPPPGARPGGGDGPDDGDEQVPTFVRVDTAADSVAEVNADAADDEEADPEVDG
jgi:hypothetical protein